MNNNLSQLKEERKLLVHKLENEINSAPSYKEKFIIIYKILLKSQFYYAKYIDVNIFDENYFQELLKKFEDKNITNDIKFYYFIKEKLIKPLHSGHLGIKFENDYLNNFLILYRKFQQQHENEANDKILNTEIERLLSIENLDKEKFQDFLKNSVVSPIIKPKKPNNQENLTIEYLDDTVIIKIKSFSNKFLESDAYKMKQLETEMQLHDYNNVIIDIRGNDGGTDQYFKLLSFLSNQNITHELSWYNLFNDKVEKDSFTAISKGTNKEYNKFLLVNNKCFSGADSLTRLCKKSHFAKIIGENTRGEGYGLTPLFLTINTKFPLMLRFTVEAPINELEQIDYKNEYNVTPDISCPGNNALNVALDIIKKKQNTKQR